MINEGRRDIRQTILPIFWPGLFLTLTVVSLNLVGDWLQHVLLPALSIRCIQPEHIAAVESSSIPIDIQF